MFSFKTVDTRNYPNNSVANVDRGLEFLHVPSVFQCHSLEGSFVSSSVDTVVVVLGTHFIRTVKEHSSKAFHNTHDKRFV